MAGSRKEYELLFKLKAALGGNFNSTFQTAMNTTKQLQNTLAKINSLSGKIDGYKRQSEAIEKNKEKLTELNVEHERLQQEMSKTEKPSEELRKKFERNARQIEQTTIRISEQEKKLGKLGSELRTAGVNTNNLEAANGKLAKSYEAVKKSQEELSKITAAQQKNTEQIKKTRKELLGTVGAVTAIGAAIYAGPVRTAAGFQAQMSKVEAISGSTKEQMTLLVAEAKKMGATTKFTAVEAGKALEYMSMAGWKTGDMLAGLEGVMDLAAASGEELGIVSDIVTDALTAFGLKASDSAHFADVLAAASSNSNTNVSLLGESFKYAAPLAGAYGFAVEDTALVLGLMANSGIKASQSGTSLRRIFTALSSDFEVAQADGAKFIVTTNNADGSMRGLKEIIDDVRTAFNGMTQAEKAAAEASLTQTAQSLAIDLKKENGELKTQAELYGEVTQAMEGLTAAGKVQEAEAIAGKTAMAGLLSIVNSSEEDYNKLAQAVYNADGAAKKMAETMLDNFEGKVILAQSALEGLQIALGDALLPALTRGMEKVTAFLTKLTQFADANPELTRTILKVAGGLATFKLATVGSKLAFLELKNGALAAQKVFTLFKGRTASASVEAMGLSNRLTTAGAGIKNYFGGIKGALGGVGSAIGQVFGGGRIATLFSGMSRVFGNAFGGIGGKLATAFGGIGGKIASIFGGVGSKIVAGPLGKIGIMIAKPFMGIGKLLAPLAKLGGAIFGPFSGLFGKIFPVVGVVMLIVSAVQLLHGHMDKVREVIENVFGKSGLVVFDKVVGVISNIGNAIKNVFTDGGIEGIRKFIDETFGNYPALTNFLNGFVTVFQTIGNIVGQFITFVNTNVKPIIEGVFNFIVGTVLPMIAQKLAEWAPTISGIIQSVWVVIQGVATAIMGIIQFLMPTIQAIISTSLSTIMGVIGGALSVIKGIIDVFIGVFTGNWKQAWEGVKSIFSGVWEAMKNIIKAPLNFIISGVNTLIRGLNKIQIPNWVPVIGGKGLSVPEIPMFEKGTESTPDTFIAGEKGAELITNAKGRKVFTAAQTGQIFNNINKARTQNNYREVKEVVTIAPTLQTIFSSAKMAAVTTNGMTLPQLQYSTNTATDVQAPTVRADSTQHSTKIEITNQPIIHIDGNKPDDLEEKLRKNNQELLKQVDERMRKREEDERRGRYE